LRFEERGEEPGRPDECEEHAGRIREDSGQPQLELLHRVGFELRHGKLEQAEAE